MFVIPTEVQDRGDIEQWRRYIAGANWRHPGGPDTRIEGRAAYPVVAVTLKDAQAYAHWKGHALPSEAQWERAREWEWDWEWEWAARAARPEPPPTHEPPSAANTWQGIFPVLNSGDDGFVLAAALLASQRSQILAAAEAYLFGYPLVITDVTCAHAALTVGPPNQLRRVRQFPDAHFKGVVRPNVDTLYTTAFIDMDPGPWVFEMAANTQRYEVMAFMDGWTNVFAAPGTRVSGTGGEKFLLAGQGCR